MVILHLSDLHFGAERESDVKGLDERNICLSKLINCIEDLSSDWRPKTICISGDLGYAGRETDYNEAGKWLQQLLDVTDLSPKEIIICAGNHDVDRQVKGIFYPPTADEADKALWPVPDHYVLKFNGLSSFCDSFGIPRLNIHEHSNYLIGAREIDRVNFVVLNSSWYCSGPNDKGNLWIGLPHIQALEIDGVLGSRKNSRLPCIVLTHHPRNWLHDDEHVPYAASSRKNTIDYLAQRSDIILTGHTHSGLRRPDQIAGSAWHIASGASFDNAGFFNNFSLIRLENSGFQLNQFEFNPRSSDDQPWEGKGITKYSFSNTKTSQETDNKKKIILYP